MLRFRGLNSKSKVQLLMMCSKECKDQVQSRDGMSAGSQSAKETKWRCWVEEKKKDHDPRGGLMGKVPRDDSPYQRLPLK